MNQPPSTRMQKFCKIKNLHQSTHVSPVDIIAMIANIGSLQEVNSSMGSQEFVREIFLFDDSRAMVKIIVRPNVNSCGSENFERFQVLLVRNAYVVKRKNCVTLLTAAETELKVLENTPEAIALNQWYFDNGSDLATKGFHMFFNLSKDFPFQGEPGVQSTSFSNLMPKSSEKKDSINKTDLSVKEEKSKKQKLQSRSSSNCRGSSSEDPPAKVQCIDSATATLEQKNIEMNHTVKQESTGGDSFETLKLQPAQSVQTLKVNAVDSAKNSSAVEGNLVGILENPGNNFSSKNNTTVVDRRDEIKELLISESSKKDIQSELKKYKKKLNNEEMIKNELILKSDTKNEIKDEGQTKNENSDFNEKDVVEENFKNLMESQFFSHKNEWSQEQDENLMNFIIKNPGMDLKCTSTYDQLLKYNLDVFGKQITSEILKNRVEELGSIKNYFYLMQLCGGKNIRTEKEKNLFINSVEKLRHLMCFIPKNE